jgi:hypothetical protein
VRRSRPLLAAGLAALLITAVACGDDDDEGASDTTSVVSTEPPASSEPAAPTTVSTPPTTEPEATMPDTTPPTSGAADDCPAEPTVDAAGFLVGLTEDEAAEAAEACGWTTRVVRRDGQDQAITLDFRPTRVNVEVTDGEVTAIVDIG